MRAVVCGIAVVALLINVARAADEGIHWQPNLEAAKLVAAKSNRLVLVHFWATWCGPCRKVEERVFAAPGIGADIEANYVPVKLDLDRYPALGKSFGVQTIPTDIILTPQGQVVQRFNSSQDPRQYVATLNRVAVAYREHAQQAALVAAPAAPSVPAISPSAMLRGGPTAPPAATPPAAPSYAAAPPANAVGQATPGPHDLIQSPPTPPAPSTPPETFARSTTTNPAATANVPTAPSPTAVPDANLITTAPAIPSTVPPSISGVSTMTEPVAAPPVTAPPVAAPPAVVVNQPVSQPAARPAPQPAVAAQAQMPPAARRQLPPGVPPLGLDGLCPVTLHKHFRWEPGDVRYGAIHEGRTYLFAGAAEQQEFLTDPQRYAPVMAGNDAVAALDRRQAVSGKIEHGVMVQGRTPTDARIYLFADESSRLAFEKNQSRYIVPVRQAQAPATAPRR